MVVNTQMIFKSMERDKKILFNFRIHRELYDYLLKRSKDDYTTMTQYLIDLIKKDKDSI
jgi:hypothetical protein